jgi:hypothetical protein
MSIPFISEPVLKSLLFLMFDGSDCLRQKTRHYNHSKPQKPTAQSQIPEEEKF